MPNIIVRGGTPKRNGYVSQSKSRRFKPHFNRTTDRYYGSEADYTADLKKRGLEPYNPDNVTKRKQKSYKPSKWAHEMVNAAKGKNGKVGDRWKEEVAKKGGFKQVPDNLPSIYRGGEYEQPVKEGR